MLTEVIAAAELAALKRRDAGYRAVLLTSAAIVWISTPEGEFIEPQPQWADYTGHPWDVHQYSNWIVAIHPEDRAKVMADWTSAVQSAAIYRTQGRIWSARHNSWRAFQTRGVPVRDASGRIIEWVGALTDVQDTLNLLQASELRYRDLADSMPHLVWRADSSGKVDYYNAKRALFSTLGDRDDEWQLVIHPGDLEETLRAWRAAVVSGEPYEMQHRLRMLDGTYRWHLSRALPTRGPDGCIQSWYGTATDVHEHKLLTAAREQLAASLQESDQRKDEILAILSHELRNPMAAIRSATELLVRRASGDPESHRALSVIERQSKQLVRLVDDLLDVARVAQNRVQLKHDLLEIGELVEGAIEAVAPLIEERQHRLHFFRPEGRAYIRGDDTRLVQSIANILHNAAKYTDPGGEIRVEIRVTSSRVEVEVRDNGIGIREGLLRRVFDLFVQSERALDRARGGLGIGLSVVKKLIEMHAGVVRAESAGPGLGATFIIDLPRAETPATLEVVQAAPLRVPTRRILIVDDNADAADSLAMLLATEGHDARAVYEPETALRIAEAFHPQFIFLDIGLPRINGYELARRFRQMTTLNGARLAALTGYGQPEDRKRGAEAGFEHHLVKPVDLEMVQRILGGA